MYFQILGICGLVLFFVDYYLFLRKCDRKELIREINWLHDNAMRSCDLADIAKLDDDIRDYHKWMVRALRDETGAAEKSCKFKREKLNMSVLFRSAATIAFQLGPLEYGRAMYLVKKGLECDPPAEIKQELEALRDKIEKAVEGE